MSHVTITITYFESELTFQIPRVRSISNSRSIRQQVHRVHEPVEILSLSPPGTWRKGELKRLGGIEKYKA